MPDQSSNPDDPKRAWLAFESPDAPPCPFVPLLYTSAHHQEIRDAMAGAAQAEAQSNTTGPGGVRSPSAIVLFGYALVRMLTLPVA